jgi:hypothetical protein
MGTYSNESTKRVELFINTIIGFFPDEIHIPNTNVIIQGGFSSDP